MTLAIAARTRGAQRLAGTGRLRAMRAGRQAAGLGRQLLAASGALVAWLWLASVAFAASPSPSPGTGGDPRSPGQGPGLVGDPAFALLAVVAIGIGSILATLAYVRVTARRGA